MQSKVSESFPMWSTAEIGQMIRAERKSQGMTQTQLAEFSGVGLSFISNLERGKETSEIGKVLNVLHMLGLDVLLKKRG